MKSRAEPSFWRAYHALPREVRQEAKEAYRLWLREPSQPALHYKPLTGKPHLWSVRINNRGYRAIGRRTSDTMTWLFIGAHDDYMRVIGRL